LKAIGLDIGTTSVCGIVIDAQSGIVLKKEEKANNSWLDSDKQWEKAQDPNTILSVVQEILESLFDETVVSIGVTGQMHGIVYLNAAGEPVSPLYTWQDERGNLPYQDTTYAAALNSYTGYGYVTHFYNKQNGLVPDEATVFCTIHDYVAMKIAQQTKPVIHASDAASFGQFDIERCVFTADDPLLPAIVPDYTKIGTYKGATVSVAIGDNQASFMGSVCGSDSVLVNAGTGSQVSVVTKKAVATTGIEIRPYIENQYLMVGCSLCGGKAFAVLENFLRETVSLMTGSPCAPLYDVMNRLLATTEASSVTVDTRFLGTREEPNLCGSITGLRADTFSPIELLHGTVNGMANELYSLFNRMNSSCKALVGSGNGIRKNAAFAKALSDTFNASLKIPLHKEEASFGAALFSLVTANIYPCIEDAQKIIQYEV